MKLKIQFRQVDPDAKADSILTTTDYQPWSDLSILKTDGFDVSTLPNVMTLEHNQAILNGMMDEFPVNPTDYDFAYWSLSQSDENGNFENPPYIDISFGNLRKTPGLTLYFYPWSQDWASTVRVTWYATNLTTVIKSGVYAITGTTGIIAEPLTNYRRIKIEFLSTNIPHRFIKLYNIEYGTIRTLDDNDIDSAQLFEEIDPISDGLSVNTFGFSIRTHDTEFSPISGDVADDMLMKRQTLELTADNKPYGTFFLDTWVDRHNDGTVFDFQAMDAIGVMDGYRFMGSMYVNVLATDVIKELFDLCFPTGLIKYSIDSSLENIRFSGHIPISTAREALAMICFATGMICNATRSNVVRFTRVESRIESDSTFSTEDKKPWSILHDLRTNIVPPFAMTLEHNQAIMDGTMEEFPVNPLNYRWGWWSDSMSDISGNFVDPPTLDIYFSTYHMNDTFTLRFDSRQNDFASRVRVTWYDNSTVVHSNEFINSDMTDFEVTDTIPEYNHTKIEFLSTNIPFRYLKLLSIVFGKTFNIPLSEIYRGGSNQPTQYWSGVDLIAYEYTRNDEIMEIYNDILTPGEYPFEFSEPLHTLTIVGGTIINSNANYANIRITTQGIVTLTGKKYTQSQMTHSIREEVSAGQQNNICIFDGCTLLTNAAALLLIDRIWEHLSQRILIENDIRLMDREVGYVSQVATRLGRPIVGILEKLDIDMRGERAMTRVVGRVAVD